MLSDTAVFCYKCTDFYHPGDEGGLLWNDMSIDIKWPELLKTEDKVSGEIKYCLEDGTEILLSEKDKNWKAFKEI